jgi:hypothetical protein
MEKHQRQRIFIFAGHSDGVKKVLGFNSSVRKRFLNSIKLKDCEDHELLQVFGRLARERFTDKIVIEGGHDGLYAKILMKRLAGGRGLEGFGGGGTVESAIDHVGECQADR